MEKDIISKFGEASGKLDELENLLKNSTTSPHEPDIMHKWENYGEAVSKLNRVLLKLRKGVEKNYDLPFPNLPDTLHWEITNEFKNYFSKNNSVKAIWSERPPGFRSKQRADLFIETIDGKWYWIEVQTTLQNEEIEKKLYDVTTISDNNRYEEYILIFPREFEKESLFMTTMNKARGNVKTNKLRIMLYSEGNFETILELGDRQPNDISGFFGDSL